MLARHAERVVNNGKTGTLEHAFEDDEIACLHGTSKGSVEILENGEALRFARRSSKGGEKSCASSSHREIAALVVADRGWSGLASCDGGRVPLAPRARPAESRERRAGDSGELPW